MRMELVVLSVGIAWVSFFAVLFSYSDSLSPYFSSGKSSAPMSTGSLQESSTENSRRLLNVLFSSPSKSTRIFTKEELSLYDGVQKGRIFISILGQVYDVTKGRKHYGPEGGYRGFAARDGSRAFVTGEFDEKGLTDNLEGLEDKSLLAILEWVSFYEKDYAPMLGRLSGRFYNKDGHPTEAMAKFKEGVERALKFREEAEILGKKYPGCDSRWSQNEGGEVWCAKNSAGIVRDWVGVPRYIKEPGSYDVRCGCVPLDIAEKNPTMRPYEGCDPKAIRCKVKK